MSGPRMCGALLDSRFEPVPGRPGGLLAGTTFVAKDLFDIAGAVTGAGQPTWAATHPEAATHAPTVQRLLDAGSTLTGKAHTSEMAYSLSADNVHYGMPVNPAAPDRDPGGSSSGCASAVASGGCDLGLGSDTLGSIRVPASYCGIFGWRPTHGFVPLEGVHPLAPTFDTAGLLARDPALLARAAVVLAGQPLTGGEPGRVLVAMDAFLELDEDLREPLLSAADALGPTGSVDLVAPDLSFVDLVLAFRDLQGPEFAAIHRSWIDDARPQFGPGVIDRIGHALRVTAAERSAAEAVRDVVRSHLDAVLRPDDVVVLPASGRPSRRDATDEERAGARQTAATLSVVGSLAGLPAVSIPAVQVDGIPVGLGLVGRPGADGLLLRLAATRPPVPPTSGPGSV